ncbi:hypothetical protein AZI87_16935 [Bdellovibrio bacteriovorus]|uniref:Lipoprotein n=1 Tax=Bdellovibrio bacteriovorus TaxID=959 RepID=A0A161PQP7_BDEBC|nr:hypothetical protein [Bdellovibrio bacteriovorus]KYG62946.1 hypothetical protein AZI87_16935 [Bdellovibrio bacteriovorus]
MRLSLAVLGCLFLSSCAMTGKTIKDVPAIKAENIQVSPMSGLAKRTVSLSVIDARAEEMKTQSTELRAEVARAVTDALARENIKVQTSGANSLVLTIQDYSTGQFKEGCVKIVSHLTIPQKAKLNAEAASCFEMKHPFGFKLSADVTKAYEEALSLTFKNLDQALGKLNL